MAQLKLVVSGIAKVKNIYQTFKTARNAWESNWDALTPAQKNNAVTTVTNWGAANATDRIEALRVSMGLLYLAVGYLLWKELK